MTASFGCVVEGDGEVEAAGVLLRRIAAEFDPSVTIQVPEPVRTPRGKLLKPGELERAVILASRKARRPGAVFVLLDSDDDCPAVLGPELLNRVTLAVPHTPAAVVLAHREFETWFLAAAASLAGKRSLPPNIQPPPNPEAIRGAKEWLGDHMAGSRRYSERLDQPAFTHLFDLQAARTVDSFDKCYRDVTRLLGALRSAS